MGAIVRRKRLPTCVVFVGCAPLGVEVAHIDTVFSAVFERVGLTPDRDTGEAPGHWALHNYGRGPHMVCAEIAAYTHKHGHLKGFVFVERGHALVPYLGQLFPEAMIVR